MANRFEEKKLEAQILEELYDHLQNRINSTKKEYRKVGKSEVQAKDWKTGELRWEDEAQTIPLYEDVWEDVDKTEDELSEEDKLTIKVCNDLIRSLEKLL